MNNNAAASQLETIGFIESMLSDLRQMGQSIDARFLVYLIELAMIEASDIKTGKQPAINFLLRPLTDALSRSLRES